MARRTLLMVEDDVPLRRMYRQALAFAGFDVHQAGNGFEALRRIEVEKPDAIVLDLILPGVDGLSVLQELSAQAATREIPIIVVSGTPQNIDYLDVACILRKPGLPGSWSPRWSGVSRRRDRADYSRGCRSTRCQAVGVCPAFRAIPTTVPDVVFVAQEHLAKATHLASAASRGQAAASAARLVEFRLVLDKSCDTAQRTGAQFDDHELVVCAIFIFQVIAFGARKAEARIGAWSP